MLSKADGALVLSDPTVSRRNGMTSVIFPMFTHSGLGTETQSVLKGSHHPEEVP